MKVLYWILVTINKVLWVLVTFYPSSKVAKTAALLPQACSKIKDFLNWFAVIQILQTILFRQSEFQIHFSTTKLEL